MRILFGAMLVILFAAAQVSAAAPWGDLRGGRFEVQAQRQRGDGAQRVPHQDARRGERPEERDARRDGRLTEEERRDLRRDIDRANREIYKGRR